MSTPSQLSSATTDAPKRYSNNDAEPAVDAPLDWADPAVTPAADEITDGHELEGEGSRTAARAYNDAATAFTQDHAPQPGADRPAMIGLAAHTPTAAALAASPDVQVVFAGQVWRVEDASLPKALEFTHLADAEQRANEIAKTRGVGVCVRGEDGDGVSTSAAHPSTSAPTPGPTTLPRLSDMPLPQQQTPNGPPRS